MPRQSAQYRQHMALVDRIARLGPGEEALRRQLEEQARALAAKTGNLTLEAEAVLHANLDHAPQGDTAQRLHDLQRAQHIFEAHAMEAQSRASRLGLANVLCDAGRESEAIDIADQVLKDGGLRVEQEVRGRLVLAKALLLIGDVDAALQQLDRAAPLAEASGMAVLQAYVLHGRALAQLFVLIARQRPALWYPLASESRVKAPTPSVAAIRQLLEDAQALRGPQQPWPYLTLTHALLRALFEHDTSAAEEIARLSVQHLADDPPLALRATLCLSLVRRQDGRWRDVLPMLELAEPLAQQHG